jgi:16S rRNA (guanine527-N7)-methyltransferase
MPPAAYNSSMDALINGARDLLGLELTDHQIADFQLYSDGLLRANQEVNLTGIIDRPGIQIKHFLDSLSILAVLPPGPARVVDVGSGPGFPGLPLKIVRPELELTLVEATGKKAAFCEAVVQKLGLRGVSVLKGRAEDLGQDPAHRETYDWALARAVAELSVLAEYLLPLVRLGGHALAQKGADAVLEAQAATGALGKLGGELAEVRPVALPGLDEPRYLVVLNKVAPTPPAYPRRAGMPSKRPLT